jgi:hypothetical protein
MSEEQPQFEVLAELLRNDLYSFVCKAFETSHPREPFVPAKHVEAICWHLQQMAEGRIRRLLITVPPRHLKSICTSVGFAAWMLGRNRVSWPNAPAKFPAKKSSLYVGHGPTSKKPASATR